MVSVFRFGAGARSTRAATGALKPSGCGRARQRSARRREIMARKSVRQEAGAADQPAIDVGDRQDLARHCRGFTEPP